MKTTRLTNEIVHGDSATDSYPWFSLLSAVVWKIKKIPQESTPIAHSLYYSVIVEIAGVLEGFINHILETVFEERTSISYSEEELEKLIKKEENDTKIKYDEFTRRLIDNIREKLQNSTWSGYGDIFNLVFGKSIIDSVGLELWKCVKSIFTFRNMIIHGKVLTVNYIQINGSDEYSISLENKYQSVYSYLTEMKLIESGQTGYIDIVNFNIIKHYYESMNLFMNRIIDNIENKEEKERIIEIFSMDDNLIDILPD